MLDVGHARALRIDDVPAAFQLSAEAGWNQTEEDWRTLLKLAPATCLAIEIDGELAATTTLLCYRQRLAWLGMVLTKKKFQRRGLAKTLLRQTLERADQMGIETIRLDATDQGQPLYEQVGFQGEQVIERWSRPGTNAAAFSGTDSTSTIWREHDLKYFGADRLALLDRLAARGPVWTLGQSYLFARAGRFSPYLGPCAGNDPNAARELIKQCVKHDSGSWTWDLFPANPDAVGIAKDLGFTPQRRLLRMARGKDLPENTNAIYAIAGFELG